MLFQRIDIFPLIAFIFFAQYLHTMTLFDIDKWSEIWQTLQRNKSRSLLTAFGVFWGIFMLTLLLGGANGFQALLQKNFDGFAQNSYFMMTGKTTKPYKGFQVDRTWMFHLNDLAAIRKEIPEVRLATPMVLGMFWEMTYKTFKTEISLKGVNPDYDQIENPHIIAGRFLQITDVTQQRRVCVITTSIAAKLSPNDPQPLGKYVKTGGSYFQVIGIANITSNMGVGGNSTRSVFIPFSVAQNMLKSGNDFAILSILVKDHVSISSVQPKIERLLCERHSVDPTDTAAYTSINMEAMFQMVQSLFSGINILVWLIGLGTLLSGAIGISNIMMVVVKERTTEIGIRRAIGAKPRDILSQIMSESVVITLLAGIGGIIIAVWILAGMDFLASGQIDNYPLGAFSVNFFVAIATLIALSIIGILAGIAPSLRALAIKPIDAIRDE